MLTKDRIGGALAAVAAIVGLVLVFSFHQPQRDADDDARPGTSQVQPGQDDDDQPAVPGRPAQQAPAPAQDDDDQPGQPAPGQPAPGQPAPGQPAPAPAGDGDDDG